MRSVMLAAAMILVLPTALAAAPQQGAASASATPASKVLDPNERICKDVFSGSRVAPKRVCATRAQWADRERQDKDETQLMQRPVQTCVMMAMRSC